MRCINDVDIGERLKKLREKSGAKMIDIAIEFNISMAQYSRLESGKGRISVDVLNKACQYYGRSIDYILFGAKTSKESIFFQKVQNFKEKDIRRFLKVLCCLLDLDESVSDYKKDPMYKLFMGGLIEKIPCDAANAMPYVLDYERNLQKISENTMIEELEITRFKWNSIMRGTAVNDIMIPLMISERYGYDLDFLINNRIPKNLFFDNIFFTINTDRQVKIMKLFDEMIIYEGQELCIEVQEKKVR